MKRSKKYYKKTYVDLNFKDKGSYKNLGADYINKFLINPYKLK